MGFVTKIYNVINKEFLVLIKHSTLLNRESSRKHCNQNIMLTGNEISKDINTLIYAKDYMADS